MKNSIILWLFLPQICLAQLFDNTWLLGYNNDADTSNQKGIQVITFPNGNLQIRQNPDLYRFDFNATNTSLSDSSGQVLSYSNGVHIGNGAWEIMENGDFITGALEDAGAIWSQWVLMLPYPGHPNQQLFFCEEESHTPELSVYAYELKYGVLDMSLNGGKGKVLTRDILLLEDTLCVGKISACKHANGRDWWVLVNEKNSNRFYRYLLDPQGIHEQSTQIIGLPVIDGVGQSGFSPNGEWYFIYATVSSTLGAYINLYHFDRCTGLLSNHLQYHFTTNGYGGGAFSPDSRYLYINKQTKAYQYDLEAPDIWGSRVQVAEYDGIWDPLPTTFYLMQLAPDGKIYSSCTNGVLSMHIIHQPDEAGLNCQYQQRGLKLPVYNTYSVPTFPNFRLGPVDGTSCDSLGLDNRPVSWWRSERDTLDGFAVYFHDLSYYEPTSWVWDFGDGSAVSTARHPVHTFPGNGSYNVCLTVSNANASHTLCRTLTFGNTPTENPHLAAQVSVLPTPFSSYLSVSLSAPLRQPEFRLYDATGRMLHHSALAYGLNDVDTNDLPAGIYFWEIRAAGALLRVGKTVKM